MADEKTINTRILLKYDTLEKWNASTGILKPGEVAIATVPEGSTAQEVGGTVPAPHQVLVKVGDGAHTFAQLPYITAKAGDVYAWAKQKHPVYVKGTDDEGAPIYGDLSTDFLDVLARIVELEGFKDANSDIGKQIEDALDELDANFDLNPEGTTKHKFATAIIQENGKITEFTGRELVKEDIPTIDQSQVSGLETALTEIDGRLDVIEGEGEGSVKKALADAEAYAKDLVDALTEEGGAVKANADAITVLQGKVGDVADVAGAIATAKQEAISAAAADATSKANAAEAAAKSHTNIEIGKVNEAASILAGRVKTIEDDYLKATDKTELANATKAVAEDLSKEVTRATEAEVGLRADVDTIKADYLKAADKQELQDNINTVAGALERLTDGISPEEIDGVNDLIAYVKDHGAEVIGMQEDIAENAKAISEHKAFVTETYETKEDATAKYDEVVDMINEKVVKADWNQNDETAPDYIKNRTHYEEEAVLGEALFENTIESFTLDEQFGGYYNTDTIVIEDFTLEEGKTYAVTLDGETYYSECKRNYYCYIGGRNIGTEEYPFSIYNPYTGYEYTLNIKVATPGPHTVKIAEAIKPGVLKQLDEKFIPDTIARVSDVETVEGSVEELRGAINGEIDRAKEAEKAINEKIGAEDLNGYDTLIAAINAANDGVATNAAAIEILNGDADTEGSVAKAVADAEGRFTEAIAGHVKTITGDDYIKVDAADPQNVKLTFDVSNIVLVAGDSSNLDPATT